MNICLFIFLFLFHFDSNKERFFFIFNNNKYEFALNTAEDGISFYKELKEQKTIRSPWFSGNSRYFWGGITINGPLKFISENENTPKKGKIIIQLNQGSYGLFMFANDTRKFIDINIDYFVRVGNIIPSKEFDTFFNSLTEANIDTVLEI